MKKMQNALCVLMFNGFYARRLKDVPSIMAESIFGIDRNPDLDYINWRIRKRLLLIKERGSDHLSTCGSPPSTFVEGMSASACLLRR